MCACLNVQSQPLVLSRPTVLPRPNVLSRTTDLSQPNVPSRPNVLSRLNESAPAKMGPSARLNSVMTESPVFLLGPMHRRAHAREILSPQLACVSSEVCPGRSMNPRPPGAGLIAKTLGANLAPEPDTQRQPNVLSQPRVLSRPNGAASATMGPRQGE